MLPSDTIFQIFLIFQLCLGVLGNTAVLMLYIHNLFFKPHFKKLIDLVFMHLTIVNMLTIIFTLIKDIMLSFGVPNFLGDVGCKAFLFLCRVSRGLSICTTCVLSTFQVITITPSNSKWAWIKPRLSIWIFYSLLFSWLINILIYGYMLDLVMAKINNTHVGHGYSDGYCQNRDFDILNPWLFITLIMIHDFFFVGVMMWASFYMVIFLYRHRKRAQHLHSPSLSSQSSPERKATHSILSLVSCFVLIYWLNNSVTLHGFYTNDKIPRLDSINAILSTCYPTICPFLLMKNNKVILQFTSSFSVLKMSCFQSSLHG
ncbi:LOW QUALITY PROTEIN: vomeronasal type-1 receptor 4-like [Arvicanthis niloticus]|uniref:LOW QUALITY PROTEIN: vomeronasal type-1 receptor 4-like n=1 Tax=Arvicanthis niloticus TaxID=61156 RepID=UPI001485F011|nr:LOW QUALITY PROTEIN: vomeronasal type-1 receptor 4-like [Arvicanthis niloticus]